MILEYFKIAIGDIRHRKKRSWLTMIGIIIGIVAVISLITLGQGVEAAVNEQFEMMGADLIMVFPGSSLESSFVSSSATTMTQHDIDVIKRVSGVDLVGGIIFKITKIEFKDEIKYSYVIGIPTDDSQDIFFSMQQVGVEEGQERFKPSDKYKAAVGYLVSKGELFEKPVSLKSRILINDQEFEVASVLGQIGSPEDDKQIYIPLETAEEIFNETDEYYYLMVKSKKGFEPSEVADDINEALRKDRGLARGDEDFNIQTTEQFLEAFSSILSVIQMILLGIAGISLLVGGIGIMNTMYTSVLERTMDIGTMKAIGAKNTEVLAIFLIESGLLGLIGGAIGTAIGLGIAKSIEYYTQAMNYGFISISLSYEIIIGSLLFSFLIGIVSGLLPSIKALRLRIVDAMRYE